MPILHYDENGNTVWRRSDFPSLHSPSRDGEGLSSGMIMIEPIIAFEEPGIDTGRYLGFLQACGVPEGQYLERCRAINEKVKGGE